MPSRSDTLRPGRAVRFPSADITLGEIQSVIRRVGGAEGFRRLSRGLTVPCVVPLWPAWRTITHDHADAAGYCSAIEEAGLRITPEAAELLEEAGGSFTVEPLGMPLVRVSAYELLLHLEGVSSCGYTHFFERALEFGLGACLWEDAPALRLAYRDQPWMEQCVVATDPSLGERRFELTVGSSDDVPELRISAWESCRIAHDAVYVFRKLWDE
ncbi:MAG TPA: hypothetical protein VFL98_02170 [Candidatus Paceibacterota bacterium]|nr:hypothetical protein [Candidatus Paceibacterota bacterium]